MTHLKRHSSWLLFAAVLCLVIIDVVVSNIKQTGPDPVVDELIYESGSDLIDGYTQASITTHAAIVNSQYSGLSFSKGPADTLTNAEIREMVYKAIELDKQYGTVIPALKYKINALGANAWVAVKANTCYFVGEKFTPGDQTDPRVIWALLDYVADSTGAQRISLLAGGTYQEFAGENEIFEKTEFNGIQWNYYFPDLPDTFSLKLMTDLARARHPAKTFDCINLNYNEILEGGAPYNALPDSERTGKLPLYYPVPDPNTSGIGALTTTNTVNNNGYNPTDAVLNCDFYINIPVIKTTADIQFNCGMKNYIGAVSRGVYGTGLDYPRDRSRSLDELDHEELVKTVVNLFCYHPADYTIIDGTASLEGDGSHPWSWRTGFFRRNLVIASDDPVAAEAVAAASVNFNPHDLDHLRWARAKGFGYYELSKILIFGTPLDSVRSDMIAPMGYGGTIKIYPGFDAAHYMGRGCRRWLINGPYTAGNLSVSHIDEAKADPRAGDVSGGRTWTAYYSDGDQIDLAHAANATANDAVVYAFTQIYSETAQSGKLYVGGVRDIRVLVNGVQLIDTSNVLLYRNVNVVRDVSLQAGDNRILVKARKYGDPFVFSLAVVNDGALSPRDTYVPYLKFPQVGLDTPRTFTAEMKRSYFGGRTLFGTFYHLGESDIGVEAGPESHVLRPVLTQNSPNPFHGRTRIGFRVPGPGARTELALFDLSGRKLMTLFSGRVSGGKSVYWDGRDRSGKRVAGGIYLIRLHHGRKTLTRRMVFVR
jgi:hypothetical protein